MDKPKESKVRTRVMEILRNHDQEARVIEAQIAAEKEALEADLEFILESAYPSSQLSDAGVRVQSSPDPDGRLVRMVDKRDRRRQRANEAIGNLERQLQQRFKTWSIPWTPVRNASFLPCTILTGHTTKRPNSFKSKGQPSIDKEKSP